MTPTGMHKLGVLPIAFLAACGGGAASSPDGSPSAGGTGGVQNTGGVQGTGGVSGGPGATAGTVGTGGVSGGPAATAGTVGRGGVSGGPAATAGTVGTGGGGGRSPALSFKADIWPVFDQDRQPVFVYRGGASYSGCTAASPCHGSSPFGARLSMFDSDAAYTALVNVASVSGLCAGATRVVPEDPDRSCLVLFYRGRLKDDLQWVGDAEIDLVRRWIAGGALP